MSKESPDWFKTWFNQDYVELYSKRNAKEAERQVSFLFQLEEVKRRAQNLISLDVACGTGRHLNFILTQIKEAYGLDLSKVLLGNSPSSSAGKLVVGDMRKLPFKSSSLNLLTSFFTSFGYFCSSAEERLVLSEFSRVLQSGGLVFFDLANKQYVVDNLIPETTFPYGKGSAHIKKSIVDDGNRTRVIKTIELKKSDGKLAFHTEDVHLFDANELYSILKLEGFSPIRTYGGFSGEEYSLNSERLIVLAKKD